MIGGEKVTFPVRLVERAPEQGAHPLPGERREGYGLDERARLMAEYPWTAQAGAQVFTDCERHFEEGPALVVEGIGAAYRLG
ncbi:TetR/AcrR family transcriptional regulator C-terminal domain-containing protein [Streptomyces sp. WG7]|uniref:TetR/AcrR family transcriptional regulator C-terminal domain-containing protein n=1 Tax=Streptomyces sp. WG7 TaxID=3417650 RepID=UPI003CEE46D5